MKTIFLTDYPFVRIILISFEFMFSLSPFLVFVSCYHDLQGHSELMRILHAYFQGFCAFLELSQVAKFPLYQNIFKSSIDELEFSAIWFNMFVALCNATKTIPRLTSIKYNWSNQSVCCTGVHTDDWVLAPCCTYSTKMLYINKS